MHTTEYILLSHVRQKNPQICYFSPHDSSLLDLICSWKLPASPSFSLSPPPHILNDGWHFPPLCRYQSRQVTSRHISIFIVRRARLQSQLALLAETGKRHQEAGTDCKAVGVPPGMKYPFRYVEQGGGGAQAEFNSFICSSDDVFSSDFKHLLSAKQQLSPQFCDVHTRPMLERELRISRKDALGEIIYITA